MLPSRFAQRIQKQSFSVLVRNQRSDLGITNSLIDVLRLKNAEHHEIDRIVLADRGSGRIHDLEVFLENFLERKHIVFDRVGMRVGIFIINAVDQRRLQDDLRLDLSGSESGGCIGGKERITGSAAEDHDSALFQMADRAVTDIRLGNLTHADRGLDTNVDTDLFQRIGNAERVDSRREHTHMIGSGTIHLSAGAASPEIAAADNDRYLNAVIDELFDGLTVRGNGIKINAVLPSPG